MITDSITAPAASHAAPATSPATTPATPRLELDGLLVEHGKHFAAIRVGSAVRMLPVRREHLESFAAFQRLLQAEGIDARHPRVTWREAVRRAFARGER